MWPSHAYSIHRRLLSPRFRLQTGHGGSARVRVGRLLHDAEPSYSHRVEIQREQETSDEVCFALTSATMLDFVQILLAVAIPAFGLLLLIPLTFFLNSFTFYQQFSTWLRPRPPASMRHMGVVITGASSGIGEVWPNSKSNLHAVETMDNEYDVLLAYCRSWPSNLLVEVLPFCLQLAARVACSLLLACVCN